MVGIAVMGLDLKAINYPYNVLAYIPGHNGRDVRSGR